MRSRINSWNNLLTKLGFTRKNRGNRRSRVQSRWSRTLRGERLEDRRVLSTTLFLDFGGGIGVGNSLNTTVAAFRNIDGVGLNGNGTGSDLTSVGMSSTSSLEFEPLAYDFNGDSSITNADITALANAVVPIVQRALEPFDIVVQVAAATSLADVVTTLHLNDDDPDGEFDAYSFVISAFSNFFGGGSVGDNAEDDDDAPTDAEDGAGLFGIAAGDDLFDQSGNNQDEAALTFADTILSATTGTPGTSQYNSNLAHRLAYTATHEAFHTLTAVHTSGAGNRNALSQGDVIRVSASSFARENQFIVTNFDLDHVGLSVSEPNNYLMIANDPDIGLADANSNSVPDLAYVTGTGAFDRITLTNAGSGNVSVLVEAFTTSAMTTSIASESYTISLSSDTDGTILIDGSLSDDLIIIDTAIAADFRIRGGTGTDSLRLQGNVNYLLEDGEISFGSQSAVYSETESLSVIGGSGNNSFDVSAFTGAVSIDGSSNSDTIVASRDANFTLQNSQLAIGSQTITLTSMEAANLTGGTGNNTLNASSFTGSVTLSGGSGNDTLTGGSGNDTLDGGVGDDSLTGSSGNDTYVFGSGVSGADTVTEAANADTDTLDFQSYGYSLFADLSVTSQQTINGGQNTKITLSSATGIENFIGSAAGNYVNDNSRNNVLTGGAGGDTFYGGVGDDQLFGNGAFDYLYGGSGNDTLDGGDSNDTLEGIDGNDTLTGGAGNDYLYGGSGNDTINGSDGNDYLHGDIGDDSLTGGAGNDTYAYVSGVSGADTITEAANADTDTLSFQYYGYSLFADLSVTSQQTINGSQNTKITLSSSTGIENFIGSAAGNYVNDNSRNNVLTGGALGDTFYGGVGDDQLFGNAGSDYLYGGSGNDTLDGGDGNDTLEGIDGNDTLTGGSGNDYLYGGSDNDSLSDSSGNDYLYGDAGNDSLTGGAGDDSLTGGSGNDTYVFGAGVSGADSVTEAANADTDTLDFQSYGYFVQLDLASTSQQIINSGPNTRITLSNSTGIENVLGSAAGNLIWDNSRNNLLYGGAAGDTFYGGAGDDEFFGNDGNDLLFGGSNNDTLHGGNGNDYIEDTSGNNSLYGDDGDDTLIAGTGDDLLVGGNGTDNLTGGGGNDTIIQ